MHKLFLKVMESTIGLAKRLEVKQALLKRARWNLALTGSNNDILEGDITTVRYMKSSKTYMEEMCCHITVDFLMVASSYGFGGTCKLSLHKKMIQTIRFFVTFIAKSCRGRFI
jgi:hypothetical protein